MWGYLLLFYVFFKANSNLSRTVRTYGGSAATLLTLVLYVWAVLVLHRRSTARSCALSDSLLTWMHVSLHFGTLVWVMQMIFSARYGSQQEHDCYGYMRQRGFRDDVEHVVPPQWEAPVIPLDEPGRIRYFKVPARLQADGTMSIAGYKAKADVHFSQQRIVNDLEPTKCVALCRDLSLACCLLSMLTSHSPLALSISLTHTHTHTLSLYCAGTTSWRAAQKCWCSPSLRSTACGPSLASCSSGAEQQHTAQRRPPLCFGSWGPSSVRTPQSPSPFSSVSA